MAALHGGTIGVGAPNPNLPHSVTYTPDYQSLLANDPGYMAIKQTLSAQGTTNDASRKQAINQALIQYGAVPDLNSVSTQLGIPLAQLQALIDPATGALAKANSDAGLSTTAQLAHQEANAMRDLRNNLAARGALSSGDDAYRTNEQNLNYSIAQNNALQSLLGALTGANQSYLTNQSNIDTQLTNGLTQALSGLEANPIYTPSSLSYNAKSGKYVSGAGGTYTPTKNKDGTWSIVSDQTGQQFKINSNGTLSPA